MDIQRLRYFLEVVRQRNFTAAAGLCRVSQPSLSQQIKKLEEEVGGLLLRRSRQSVDLTPLGASFLRYAQAIMTAVDTAEEFIDTSQRNTRRTVRLGAIPTVAPYVVPALFTAIRARQPSARFELVEAKTDSLVGALQNGTVDFALLSPPTTIDEETDSLSLGHDEMLLVLPLAHPLARAPTITLEHLREENILLLEASHCLSQQLDAYCRRTGLTAEVSIQGYQLETLLRLVESGFGLTFIPGTSAQATPDRAVVFRSLQSQACFREIRLYWLTQPVLSLSQHAVIEAFEALVPVFPSLAEGGEAVPTDP